MQSRVRRRNHLQERAAGADGSCQRRPGGSARTAAMGGSASTLLDEGKCTYIRGTRAGASREPRTRPGACTAARTLAPEGAWGSPPRARCPAPALHLRRATCGRGVLGGPRRPAGPAFSLRRRGCTPALGRGGASAGGPRAGGALGSAAARLREAGAGRGVGDATLLSRLSPPWGLFRPGPRNTSLPPKF